MTHRAESIMVAVLGKITGLTTTGTNVARGRAYPVADTAVPALTLEMGDDAVVLQNIANIDRVLDIVITAHVKTTSQYDTDLNKIRSEVHVALMADYTQGLSAYVLDTMPLGDDAPEIAAADKTISQMKMHWQIKYRHSVTNPGA